MYKPSDHASSISERMTLKLTDNGIPSVPISFSLRRLKILESTLDTFPDAERTLGVGSTINVSPNPSAACAGGKPRKENLLTLNNKSGRSFVPLRALSEYPTARYEAHDAKARAMRRT